VSMKVPKGWKSGVPLWLPIDHVTLMELSTYFLASSFTLIGLVCVIADVGLIVPSRNFSCARCLDKYIKVEDACLFGKPISFQLSACTFVVGL